LFYISNNLRRLVDAFIKGILVRKNGIDSLNDEENEIYILSDINDIPEILDTCTSHSVPQQFYNPQIIPQRLHFPPSMDHHGRRLIHEIAEEKAIYHKSVGEMSNRYIEISVIPFPLTLETNFSASKSMQLTLPLSGSEVLVNGPSNTPYSLSDPSLTAIPPSNPPNPSSNPPNPSSNPPIPAANPFPGAPNLCDLLNPTSNLSNHPSNPPNPSSNPPNPSSNPPLRVSTLSDDTMTPSTAKDDNSTTNNDPIKDDSKKEVDIDMSDISKMRAAKYLLSKEKTNNDKKMSKKSNLSSIKSDQKKGGKRDVQEEEVDEMEALQMAIQQNQVNICTKMFVHTCKFVCSYAYICIL
jgi:hypothetical protein